jgi:sortase (surface protein transpeptidase)
MKIISRILLGAAIVCIAVGATFLVVANQSVARQQQEEDKAYQEREQSLELLDIPAASRVVVEKSDEKKATTRITSPSDPDQTTTTTTEVQAPVLPERDTLSINQVFGWIDVPRLEKGNVTLARADERDDGYEALAGGAAWFPSSYKYADGSVPNNLSLPGEGGVVAIGGHRTTASARAPFANLHLMEDGDLATVVTTWGVYTYRVVTPCQEGAQEQCTMSASELMPYFASYESDVETLFLFSCDDGKRIFVTLSLESAVAHDAVN